MVVLRLYPLQNLHDGQLGSIRLLGYDINTAQVQARRRHRIAVTTGNA